MSSLLQKILIALARRGVQTPIDQVLGNVYRALIQYHEKYPSVFVHAADILLAEVEGGATELRDVPQRLGTLCVMLDRLHRQEELDVWADDDVVLVTP